MKQVPAIIIGIFMVFLPSCESFDQYHYDIVSEGGDKVSQFNYLLDLANTSYENADKAKVKGATEKARTLYKKSKASYLTALGFHKMGLINQVNLDKQIITFIIKRITSINEHLLQIQEQSNLIRPIDYSPTDKNSRVVVSIFR